MFDCFGSTEIEVAMLHLVLMQLYTFGKCWKTIQKQQASKSWSTKLQSWLVAGLIAAGSQVFLSTTFCNRNRAGCRTRVRDSFSVLSGENWKLSTSIVFSVLFTLDTLSELSPFHQTQRSNFQTPFDLFLLIKECPGPLQLLRHQPATSMSAFRNCRPWRWCQKGASSPVRAVFDYICIINLLVACANFVQGTLQRKVTARLGAEVHRGCPGQSGQFRPRCNSKGVDLIDPNRKGKTFWPASKT